MDYLISERVMIIVLASLVIHTNTFLTTNISLNRTLEGERTAGMTPCPDSATLESHSMKPLTGDCHLNYKYAKYVEETPPLPTHIRTRFSCDDKAKICNSTIEWTQPEGKPSVKRYFIMLYTDKRFPNTGLLFCYQLPNSSRSLVIPSKDIPIGKWVHRHGVFTTDFQIGAETVCGNPPPYTQLKGPTPIEITSLEKQAKAHEGEPYNFTCEFTGYPAPTAADIVWKHNDTDVMKKDGYDITFFHKSSSLTILHVSKDDSGSFSCHIKNYLGDSNHAKVYSFNVLPKPPLPPLPALKNIRYIIAGGLLSGVLVVALAIYGLRVLKRRRRAHELQNPYIEIQQRHTIYVSHHSQGEEQKKSILKFAYNLEKHSPKIAVVVDLTRQVEINESGGIAQWIPKRMSEASRILVVLSKEYLEVLNVNKSSTVDVPTADDNQASKVLTEYRFIENMLHQSFHVSEKLIIAWRSEEKGELPHVFQGRNSFILPRKKKDFVESSLLKLLGDHEENKTESV